MEKDTCITNLRDLIKPSNTDDENEALLFAIEGVRARGNAQKVVVVPPEVITKLSNVVVDLIGKINWDAAMERYYKRPHAEWREIKSNNTKYKHIYYCNNCRREIGLLEGETLYDYPFCHCGADMRGGAE